MRCKFSVIIIMFVISTASVGCDFNIPYAHDRNYEAEYQAAKTAIKRKCQLFQKDDELLSDSQGEPKISPFEIAKKYELISPYYLKEEPERKGIHRAGYEMATEFDSLNTLNDKNNIGKYYLIEGTVKNLTYISNYNHFLISIKEKNTDEIINVFSWNARDNESKKIFELSKKQSEVKLFAYYGGFFDLHKKNKGDDKTPIFFLNLIISKN